MANTEIPSDKKEFRCNHCNGKILIPRNLPPTTGPCPHCSGVITSPGPEAPAPVTLQAPPVMPPPPPVPPVIPPPVIPKAPDPEPRPAIAVPPPVAEPVAPAPAAAQAPKPAVEIPHASDPSHGNKRKSKPAPAPAARPNKSGLIPVMLVLLALILAGGAVVYFVTKEMGRNVPPPSISSAVADPVAKEANYLRIGWQKDAYQLLRDYMAATSSKEKLPFILTGDAMVTRLEDFYGGGVINDSDTPADAFSIYELSMEDRKRGLFMMIYDQPPQFEMKEFFRPLAPLEVQYGIDEADMLLSTLARVGNFAMEPLRVHAFFKRTPEGLKLDWEIFAQTKYRTFQNFVELPETGQVGVFRVFVVEDVPDKGRLEAGTRTYRVADPANTGDTARVNVKVDSETGRALSIINWRGTKESRPITRTATVELKWTGEPTAPELEISRFICWEFLGLGGQDTPSTASTK
jgi:hypothetical protein